MVKRFVPSAPGARARCRGASGIPDQPANSFLVRARQRRVDRQADDLIGSGARDWQVRRRSRRQAPVHREIRNERAEIAARVGLVAIYCNTPDGEEAFVTSVSIAPDHRRRSIARFLVEDAIRCAREIGFARIALEVDASATEALKLYARTGFERTGGDEKALRLTTDLSGTAA